MQDTPHFLRIIEKVNKEEVLPQNAILVTMDVSALYTNIPHGEAIQCVREALLESDKSEIPIEFIMRLLELLLDYNIFEFNQKKNLLGIAMGSSPAPSMD